MCTWHCTFLYLFFPLSFFLSLLLWMSITHMFLQPSKLPYMSMASPHKHLQNKNPFSPWWFFIVPSLSLERDRQAIAKLWTYHLASIKLFIEKTTKFRVNFTNMPLPFIVCDNCWKYVSIWIMSNESFLLSSMQMVQAIHNSSQSWSLLFS